MTEDEITITGPGGINQTVDRDTLDRESVKAVTKSKARRQVRRIVAEVEAENPHESLLKIRSGKRHEIAPGDQADLITDAVTMNQRMREDARRRHHR
jgi:hypothetical protein